MKRAWSYFIALAILSAVLLAGITAAQGETVHVTKNGNIVTITGQVKVDDPDSLTVVIAMPSVEGKAYAGGRILASVMPQIDILELRLVYPGCKAVTIPIETKNIKWGEISLGEIPLGPKEVEKPPINPENIVPVAGGLPPRSKQGAF